MGLRARITRPGIAARLLAWYSDHHRDLPWRRTSDPYRVWISEVMLQQTRAQAVIPYYERFVAQFPTLESLAGAREEQALAAWSGLGYYSRARNLLKAARLAVAAGGFPSDYDAIRGLPGVGDYTAAAVSSIAFGLPCAAVDGNALRVVSRVKNDASDIGSMATRRRFAETVTGWLDQRRPGDFNQALMELGATICLPRQPLCDECPIRDGCLAATAGSAAGLPVKLRKEDPLHIRATLFVVRRRGRVLLIREDSGARRMAGFWRLPTTEDLPGATPRERLGEFRHSITRHRYLFEVYASSGGLPACPAPTSAAAGACAWFSPAELPTIPLATTARKALNLAGIPRSS